MPRVCLLIATPRHERRSCALALLDERGMVQLPPVRAAAERRPTSLIPLRSSTSTLAIVLVLLGLVALVQPAHAIELVLNACPRDTAPIPKDDSDEPKIGWTDPRLGGGRMLDVSILQNLNSFSAHRMASSTFTCPSRLLSVHHLPIACSRVARTRTNACPPVLTSYCCNLLFKTHPWNAP